VRWISPLEQTLLLGFEHEDERYVTYRTVLFQVVTAATRFQTVNADVVETLISMARNAFSICGGTLDISTFHTSMNRIRLVNVFVNRTTSVVGEREFQSHTGASKRQKLSGVS
jgi:hypothetical protein